MMARYIDAERLINEISGNGGIFVYGPKAVTAIISRINAQPVADVEEVRHGKWDSNGEFHQCSVCTNFTSYAYDYCPYCGAKMDLE